MKGFFRLPPRYRHTAQFNVDTLGGVRAPSLRATHKKAILRRLRGVARRSLPKEACNP